MDLIQRLFYTAVGAASIFYFIVKISLSHWKNRGILHDKPKFLWGNLKGVGQKRHISAALAETYEKYKGKAPFIGYYVLLKPMALILDLELVRQILSKDNGQYFAERGLYHNADNDPLSQNLIQMDGEEWRQLHKKLISSFSDAKTQRLLPALLKVAETFQRSLHRHQVKHEIFVINELVDSYNVDVLSSLAFGLEGDSLKFPNTEFRAMTRCYLKNFCLLKAYLALTFPHLARLMQYKSYDKLATAYFLQLLNDQIEEVEWNSARRKPQHHQQLTFLQLFAKFKSHPDPKERLNNQQIAAQAFSFILAGLEASNSTLAFCLYELALQPDIQQRARTEIATVLERHRGQLNADSLKDLKYVKQILYETLRKHSPYPALMRVTVNDYEIPDSVFMLKKGNQVLVPIAAIHHDPNIYPEPKKFDPDRFEPDAVQQRHPMAWLPFGCGLRGCIALQFAEQQLLVGLVTMLRHSQFSPCSDTPIPLQYDVTKFLLTPKSDIRLSVKSIEIVSL